MLQLSTAWRQLSDSARLLLAGKTAMAATIAWLTVSWIPLAEDQYAYYAPLGAIVSMYTTVAASVKSGAQALLGLAVGIGLGVLGITMVINGVPIVAALAIVIAAGVLMGGLTALGAGRDWVAVAALFVMLLSGPDVEEYSLSYLLSVLWGVLVGVVVNLVVVPPLYLRRAGNQLAVLRDAVVSALNSVADQLEAPQSNTATISIDTGRLTRVVDDVSFEVKSADESSRANPRARWYRDQLHGTGREMQSLQLISAHANDVARVLGRLEESDETRLHGEVRAKCIAAIRACTVLVGTLDGAHVDRELCAAAESAVDEFLVSLYEAPSEQVTFRSEVWTVGFALRWILDASRPPAGSENT
ncbi:hypothetical protein FHX48_002814 [Microbacterium halimionae]|uniref:FUSC family protein n=1 Tax=Microbacterium halimionae TaxID=1526413 RepID=A0A7W3PN85_9MICO|nr:FUSC family protein [Microbacterium halimionae]MBA8817132.1 hypothetical protein [Microbacterium halimionae]MBA8817709.1 hypothetical protein [Microbacterium halimionae]NII94582.1 hypothetical protein [Microbacterium halimionae]